MQPLQQTRQLTTTTLYLILVTQDTDLQAVMDKEYVLLMEHFLETHHFVLVSHKNIVDVKVILLFKNVCRV